MLELFDGGSLDQPKDGDAMFERFARPKWNI
jgi:hypothetical protein